MSQAISIYISCSAQAHPHLRSLSARLVPPDSFPSHQHCHIHHGTEPVKRWHKAFLMAYLIYRALAEHHDVARSTLHDRAHGQRSKEQRPQSQQYLTLCEEKAVVNFLVANGRIWTTCANKAYTFIGLQRRSPAIHEQTTQASRQELGSGFRETSFRTRSKKK